MKRINIWAPPLVYGPWDNLVSLIGSSTFKVSFDTVSQAPSSFEIQIQYWRGSELVTDTVVGAGSHTFGMGSCVCVARIRAKSHSLGQNIEVIIH